MRNWACLLLLMLALGQAQAADPALEARVQALSAQLRCLVCQNQTIAESDAPLALDLRQQVRDQLARGQSEQQVMQFMVERYGDFVLYRPPLKALTSALWFGPGLLLVAALVVLGRRLHRVASLPEAVEEPDGVATAESMAPAARPGVLASAGVVAGAALLYAALGTPAAFAPERGDLTVTEADAMIHQLTEHLKVDRGNTNGWLLLARAQSARGRYDQAAYAYRQLLAITPDDVQVQRAYAEVMAQAGH